MDTDWLLDLDVPAVGNDGDARFDQSKTTGDDGT
jgi:hypothetical protein